VLIDATRNWNFKRRPEWNHERFPPIVAPEDEALSSKPCATAVACMVLERWKEYGFE
jgi:hypothetical protein